MNPIDSNHGDIGFHSRGKRSNLIFQPNRPGAPERGRKQDSFRVDG
jgi:hypothetical protein